MQLKYKNNKLIFDLFIPNDSPNCRESNVNGICPIFCTILQKKKPT